MATDLVKIIDSFIKALLAPPKQASTEAGQSPIDVILKRNLDDAFKLLDETSTGCQLKELINTTELTRPFKSNVCSEFLWTCLRCLICLSNHLQPCDRGEPIDLSVQQQKSVCSLLHFIVGLGISRQLLSGVGMPRHLQTEFGILKLMGEANETDELQRHSTLFLCVHTLLQCSHQSTLGSLILAHHMGDVLAGLCQLSFAPDGRAKSVFGGAASSTTGSETACTKHSFPKDDGNGSCDDRAVSQTALEVLVQKSYQPLVVRNLLLLQGGGQRPVNCGSVDNPNLPTGCPLWLRKAIHKLLNERILSKNGVSNVIRGILEFNGVQSDSNTVSELDRCMSVGKLMSSFLICSPIQEKYCFIICPQILLLLNSLDEMLKDQFMRIASTAIMLVASHKPKLAQRHFIQPIIKPLTDCSLAPGSIMSWNDKQDLATTITTLHKVFVLGSEPSEAFLALLRPIFGILLHIYSFLATGVLHLKNICEELLCTYLRIGDGTFSLETLRDAVFQSESSDACLRWNPNLVVSYTNDGGVAVNIQETKCADELLWLEEVNRMTDAIISLLLTIRNGKCIGRFFLLLLENLSSPVQIVPSPAVIEKSLNVESTLLNIEQCSIRQETDFKKSMLLLQILSAICQHSELQSVIVQDKTGVVKILLLTLQRWAHISETPGSENLDNEALLLTMTILAMMIESKESKEMNELLRSCSIVLDLLSKKHEDSIVRDLAQELHVAIATHGAVPMGGTGSHTATTAHVMQAAKADPLPFKKDPIRLETQRLADPRQNQGDSLNKDVHLEKEKQTSNIPHSTSTKTAFQLAWDDVLNQEIPVKGHGLLSLRKLIEARDNEAMSHWDEMLTKFRECLNHDDSYVYLMAVPGLAALGEVLPDAVLLVLINEYASADGKEEQKCANAELRMKLGEVLTKTTASLGEMMPKYRDILIRTFLGTATDHDPLIRSSSLVNLGKVCEHLRYALGPCLEEIFLCLNHTLQFEESPQVRSAAVQVITLLLRGTGVDAFKIMDKFLKELYRMLKHIYSSDRDDIVKLHAQLALEELQKISLQFIFPKQVLEKRINISSI